MKKIVKVKELTDPKGVKVWQHEKCDICCLILKGDIEKRRCKHLMNNEFVNIDWTHLSINCSSKEGINCKNIMC